MTVADDILHLLRLRPEGMSDAELAQATGKLHQHINQTCRGLEQRGVLIRESVGGLIRNRLADGAGHVAAPDIPAPPAFDADRPWYWEGNVQSALCTWLVEEGWTLVQAANTATKERGTDVVAARDGARLHVEVKGYPSTTYADPRRAGEPKPTQPSLQAGHWYAKALLAAVRLRERHPQDAVAMAFPDMPRYRSLLAETAHSLQTLRIDVLFVAETGSVSR